MPKIRIDRELKMRNGCNNYVSALILGGCGTSRKVTSRYVPRMRKKRQKSESKVIYLIYDSVICMRHSLFFPIGGCDAPRKGAHRYGPIGEKFNDANFLLDIEF